MPGSFRIGKIAGIDIDINVSWIIIVVLLTVSPVLSRVVNRHLLAHSLSLVPAAVCLRALA